MFADPWPTIDLGIVVVTGEKIDDYIKNPSQVVSMNAAEVEAHNFLQSSSGSSVVRVLINGRQVSILQ